MDLDDISIIQQLDPQNMRGELEGLPEQLAQAWALGQQTSAVLRTSEVSAISRVVISGMGGSAIGADLVAAYCAETCPIPVIVHRD